MTLVLAPLVVLAAAATLIAGPDVAEPTVARAQAVVAERRGVPLPPEITAAAALAGLVDTLVLVVDPETIYSVPRRVHREPVDAFVVLGVGAIFVSQYSPLLKHGRSRRLAGVIAHERAHLNGADERGAYAAQLETVRRLGERDLEYLRALTALAAPH